MLELNGYRIVTNPRAFGGYTIINPDGRWYVASSIGVATDQLLRHLATGDWATKIPDSAWQPPMPTVGDRLPAPHLLNDLVIFAEHWRDTVRDNRSGWEDDAEDRNRNDCWIQDWIPETTTSQRLIITWPDGSALRLDARYFSSPTQEVPTDVLERSIRNY